LFYNTAHLLHDIDKLPGVQQLIFLVYLAKIPVYDVTWSIKEKDKGDINSTKSEIVGTHLGNIKEFLYKLLAGKIIRPWKENG